MIARFAVAVLAVSLFAPADARADDSFATVAAPFFKQHCVSCHNEKKREGGVRLDVVTGVDAGNRNLWTLVHQKVTSGEMPPKENPRPIPRGSSSGWWLNSGRWASAARDGSTGANSRRRCAT